MLLRACQILVVCCAISAHQLSLFAQELSPADKGQGVSQADAVSLSPLELQQRLLALDAELQELKAGQGILPIEGVQTFVSPPLFQDVPCDQCDEFVSTNGRNGLSLRNQKDGFPTVQLTGFIQIDAVQINQDATSIGTVGEADDGADFRRARLAAKGRVAENVGYMVEFDFAFPGRPNFMDVWMEIEDLPIVNNLRIGQWRQPFGMDELTSVKELTFLERGLPFAMAPFRQIGLGVYDSDEETATTWAISAFLFPTDPFGGNLSNSESVSMSSRLTTLLYEDAAAESLVHIGANYAYLDPTSGSSRFRNTPEIFGSFQPGAINAPHVIPFFADTGIIPTNQFHLVNLETAFQRGSLTGQAEWRLAYVDQIGGASPTFQSAYGQLAYLLTGEVRPYKRNAGLFGRIVPLSPFKSGSGIGAWEAAARFSWLDLDSANIAGNQLKNVTMGLNWYLNKRTKFQFNYIHSILSGVAIPSSRTDIVAVRAQIDF